MGTVKDESPNPALSDEVWDAVNDMLHSIEGHVDRAGEAYRMGAAHAVCIQARVAPDHYLLGCALQCGTLAEAMDFAKQWIKNRAGRKGRSRARKKP